ncbi:bacteriophage N4 adsorption protein B (plasmid) [Zymomonas mobilis subsp. mobilis str. CP4 = NRRL B-14023]|nr:cyclic di-3',5'-guanylate-activated glycosyltransferase NrfB [Zymomonas mobilis]AHJ73326.1 bacteriophage N4 adsorption protein B [Zymomonas mobilis subsp. mobilis str. CP4 = NRRL B-14023]
MSHSISYFFVETIINITIFFRYIAIFVAILVTLFGIDDIFIDSCFWIRSIYRRFFIYSHYPHADEKQLFSKNEKPLAIMVPAWREVGVVANMARLAAETLDYENYHIFVGTYPNDPETQNDVDAVVSQYPNVHKIVCARPGPTSKADCLNNVIDAIFHFEEAAAIEFAGFILHDAEDVISPLELRLFNYLVARKDMIQIPVYPFISDRFGDFTRNHYVDEFSEHHGKDVVVREALTGQIPSAGVGTCFSRRAITLLLKESDGFPFDTTSLTEDYDISFRLYREGMSCIFARYPVTDPQYAFPIKQKIGMDRRYTQVICVREHFPDHFKYAVRQKSRWITGIVFQGTRNLGWEHRAIMNYFLWRDRRGIITNIVGFLANILLFFVALLWIISALNLKGWSFMSVLSDNALLSVLLWVNGFILLNRAAQRCFFVTKYYGIKQGLTSPFRMVWGNIVNSFACIRAFWQVITIGNIKRMAWDKTTHDFPSIPVSRREPIGLWMVAQNFLKNSDLEQVLQAPRQHRLGQELLLRGLINSEQLAKALAHQASLKAVSFNIFYLDSKLIAAFPRYLACRYAVLPFSQKGKALQLICEHALSPISLGVISRHIGLNVECLIAPQGRVTLGLRYWYPGQGNQPSTDRIIKELLKDPNNIEKQDTVCIYLAQFGDILQTTGHIPEPIFAQVLIDFDPDKMKLGEYLVKRKLISQEILEECLKEQNKQEEMAEKVLLSHE